MHRLIDFEPIRNRWIGLSNTCLQEYGSAGPTEWATDQDGIDAALELIADARNNIDACIGELERILS